MCIQESVCIIQGKDSFSEWTGFKEYCSLVITHIAALVNSLLNTTETELWFIIAMFSKYSETNML